MKSLLVLIQTEVVEEGYNVTVIATAEFMNGEEVVNARSVREFSSYVSVANSVSKEDAIGAFKRDALRELVTQLNLHGVL